MRPALVDTNVLFAAASARDEYHDPARAIVRGIDHGDLPVGIVTNYVVAETLNLVREKLDPETATGLMDRLVEGANFEIAHATTADFATARSLFRRYGSLSFVDATIVAYMGREGVEYLYGFDDDFDAVEGISRLTTATHPYG